MPVAASGSRCVGVAFACVDAADRMRWEAALAFADGAVALFGAGAAFAGEGFVAVCIGLAECRGAGFVAEGFTVEGFAFVAVAWASRSRSPRIATAIEYCARRGTPFA